MVVFVSHDLMSYKVSGSSMALQCFCSGFAMKQAEMKDRGGSGRGTTSSKVGDRAIAQRLCRILDQRDIPPETLKEVVGSTEDRLERALNGELHWPLELLESIGRALNISPRVLDPQYDPGLLKEIRAMDLEGDPHRLEVLHTFISELPKLKNSADLEALECLVVALARPPLVTERPLPESDPSFFTSG